MKSNFTQFYGSKKGIFFALMVLIGNGIHPTINTMKPLGFNILIFTWMMSLWECLLVLPLVGLKWAQWRKSSRIESISPKIVLIDKSASKKVWKMMIFVGVNFTIATYLYILGLNMTDSISGSIALKSSPIWALIIGTIMLHEKLSRKQIGIVIIMLVSLFYLATNGTFQITEFGFGFGLLLLVPFFWGLGHASSKPYLNNHQVDASMIIFIRSAIVFGILLLISLILRQDDLILDYLTSPIHLWFTFLMGFTYVIMHYCWYRSIAEIKLAIASALVIPSPAITVILALIITHEPLYPFHVIGMIVLFTGLYLMILTQNQNIKARTTK